MCRRGLAYLIPLLLASTGCDEVEPRPELCFSNADCQPPSRCGGGICRRACQDDADCPGVELVCTSGALRICHPRRIEFCSGGICLPCPDGQCPRAEAEPPGPEQGVTEERTPDELPHPDAELPLPDADADPLPDEFTPEPDREAGAEGDEAELEPDPDPDDDDDDDDDDPSSVLGTCDPQKQNCPPGQVCYRLRNHADFPPPCLDAVEDGTFDGDCYACRPRCTDVDQCEPHENCLKSGEHTAACVTLFCPSWRDYPPSRRGAPVRITEVAEAGTRRFTLDRVDVQQGDITVSLLARSLCLTVGTTGADYEFTLGLFFEEPPLNEVVMYELGFGAGAHFIARDAYYCQDRWNAIGGLAEVLMLESGFVMARLVDVQLEREQGGCGGVELRRFERVLVMAGPGGGRTSEGAICSHPEGNYCRDGKVCAPHSGGLCYPFCDEAASTSELAGCEASESCVEPGSGIGLLDGGVCN